MSLSQTGSRSNNSNSSSNGNLRQIGKSNDENYHRNGILKNSKKRDFKDKNEDFYGSTQVDEKEKEKDGNLNDFNLKRKRSKSFSELLLPNFKEIIPITVIIFFISHF